MVNPLNQGSWGSGHFEVGGLDWRAHRQADNGKYLLRTVRAPQVVEGSTSAATLPCSPTSEWLNDVHQTELCKRASAAEPRILPTPRSKIWNASNGRSLDVVWEQASTVSSLGPKGLCRFSSRLDLLTAEGMSF